MTSHGIGPRKLDGKPEARLVTITCSSPPTLRFTGHVPGPVSLVTQCHAPSAGGQGGGCWSLPQHLPEKLARQKTTQAVTLPEIVTPPVVARIGGRAGFLYHATSYDRERPVVCFDEIWQAPLLREMWASH